MNPSEPNMKIALLGTRGVPASYSGFETCVEQLGKRLAQRGHDVSVYCRSHHITHPDDTYLGMRLVKLPTIRNKYLDTLVHSFLSSLHALGAGYHVGIYFIAGNSPVTWIPRLIGTRTALNVDGLDWKRDKWNGPAKRYIQFAEWLAQFAPNLYLTDSPLVQAYYKDKTGKAPPYIVYGSDIDRLPPGETLAQYGLEPKRYVLFVGRLVPENNAHHLIEAFTKTDTDMKCVIVGDAPYAEAYQARLRELAGDDERIIFTGYVFGEGYRELGSNAYAVVATTGVGGTHPALIEAMAMGNCCIVNDTPVNLQTIGGHGLSYEGAGGAEALRPVLERMLEKPDEAEACRTRAAEHAAEMYSWEAVTDQYEKMCYELVGRGVPDRLAGVESKVHVPRNA
jgi:glycosyltransferase involved in cell wall biosynthesis